MSSRLAAASAGLDATRLPLLRRGRDADAYQKPYADSPAASAAIAAIMDNLDFKALCQSIDDGFRTWRQESILLFGANDRCGPSSPLLALGRAGMADPVPVGTPVCAARWPSAAAGTSI